MKNPQITDTHIELISHQATLPIRQSVLWPDKPRVFCQVEGDEDALHFGCFVPVEGKPNQTTMVAVASIFVDGGEARLRKFATLPAYQNQGIGSRMIQHIINELHIRQISHLWCDARASAIDFYARFDFQTEGDRFFKSDVAYFKMILNL